MIRKIKQILISLIGFSNYRRILVSLMRIKGRINSKIYRSEDIIECEEFKLNDKDCFFGYYDLNSINKEGTKLLSLVVDGEIADVGYFEISTKEFHKIAETKAWNWQMGARLRWYEDNKSVLFNDYDGIQYVSKIVNIDGSEERILKFPIYDLDEDRQIGYFTDFTILHYLREGYGYSNKIVDFDSYYKNATNGVFLGSLNNGDIDTLITMDEIKAINPTVSMENKLHYINHISVNPKNGDIMFFHLWTIAGKSSWYNRLFFMTPQKEIINVIDDFERASHYAWQDENHILVTLYVKGHTEYRLYDYRTRQYQRLDSVSTDGHPTFISNSCFITDTYANHYGMQSIYFCDAKEQKYKNLFSIYHSPRMFGVHRCDLHPRVKGSFINIDSVSRGYRSQYVLRINEKCKMNNCWDNKIILDSMAKNSSVVSRSLWWCIKSEYSFLKGCKKVNMLKGIFCFFLSPTFRVNVYISWMQHSKNIYKRRLIRNHLEIWHALIVDQSCIIGNHFRIDHPVGVVIGPGVKIGNYVKLYQNVTLGKKNGKFPAIGNNVVIYAGAVVIGDVTIGDNSIIGANAVVLKDVPCNSVAVGVPAKIMPRKDNE